MHIKFIKHVEPNQGACFEFYLSFGGSCGCRGGFSSGLSGPHRAEILVRRIPVLEDLRSRHDYRNVWFRTVFKCHFSLNPSHDGHFKKSLRLFFVASKKISASSYIIIVPLILDRLEKQIN